MRPTHPTVPLSSEVEKTSQQAALCPLRKLKAAAALPPAPRDDVRLDTARPRLDTRPVPSPRVSTARAPHVRASSVGTGSRRGRRGRARPTTG